MIQTPLKVEQVIQMARSTPNYQEMRTPTRQWSATQEEAFIRGWREASLRAIPWNKPIPGKPHSKTPQIIKTSDGRFLEPNEYIGAFVAERTGTSNKSRKCISSRQVVYRNMGTPSWEEDEMGRPEEAEMKREIERGNRVGHGGYRL